jgi:tRNA threonylcarbamoyladenosine biosynthesis protein TsaE
MASQSYQSHSESATQAFAARLAGSLRGGEILALVGPLGSGKTCFAKGIARGLGISQIITSPSFVLLKSYHGHLTLHHVDFYRLETPDDYFSIGMDELLSPDAVTVIEWADRFLLLLPKPLLLISFEIFGRNDRQLSFEAHGAHTHHFNYLLKNLDIAARRVAPDKQRSISKDKP